MSKLTCDSHIPVRPATKKKKIKEVILYSIKLFRNIPFNNVYVQFTTFIVAGNDIMIVIVLYKDLLLWSSPTRYIWCPQTKKPI
jgi:hypothetical protein